MNIRLWRDIPPEQRVDREYFMKFSRFYVRGQLNEDALTVTLRRQADDALGCEVAVLAYNGQGRFQRCMGRVIGTAERCTRHGGPGRPKLSPTEQLRLRYAKRLAALDRARLQHCDQLSIIDKEKEAISKILEALAKVET